MASTVLPNGIIIPEKYSRDWYADLYHNWQELDNLLGGGGANDGTLTIQKNGTTVGTFSANQATDETINITVPTVNDATLTIQKNGTTVDTFTANSSTDKTVDITVPTKTSDLTNDIGFITSDDTKIPLAGSNQISGSLIPATTDAYDLGGSSYRWKDVQTEKINNLNPGALSLPSTATGYVDIKSTVGEYLRDNNTNVYEFTAPFDGWICVGIVKGSLRIDNITASISSGNENLGWWQSYTIPFTKNDVINIKINKMDATDDYVNDIMWKAHIYPCQGNV